MNPERVQDGIVGKMAELCKIGVLEVPHNKASLLEVIGDAEIVDILRVRRLSYAEIASCEACLDPTSPKDKSTILYREYHGTLIQKGIYTLTNEQLFPAKKKPSEIVASLSSDIVILLVDAIEKFNNIGPYRQKRTQELLGNFASPDVSNAT